MVTIHVYTHNPTDTTQVGVAIHIYPTISPGGLPPYGVTHQVYPSPNDVMHLHPTLEECLASMSQVYRATALP